MAGVKSRLTQTLENCPLQQCSDVKTQYVDGLDTEADYNRVRYQNYLPIKNKKNKNLRSQQTNGTTQKN